MSRRYYSTLFLGTVFCSYIALCGASIAASPAAVNTNKTKEVSTPKEMKIQVSKPVDASTAAEYSDSWYGKSVFERPRADYTNESARLGSFKIKPYVSLEESYDSNIYAVQRNTSDDFITSVKPGVSLESDWSRHALSLNATGDIGSYSDHSAENYGDYSVGGSGRLDLLKETFILANASTSQLHEDRGSPESRANSKSPTEYTQNNAGLTFMRNLRRVALKLDGDVTQYNYENGKTSSGATIRNNDRNREEYKVTGRLGYEIIPEYEAFIRSTLNERNYDAVDNTGVNRDSNGYEVVAGTALNLGGKTKGEVFAGYLEQKYDSSRLKDVDGVQFGGNVLWNATSLTSVKAGITRGVQETVEVNNSGYISTLYSLRVEHELLYNVLAGLNTSYSVNDYEGTNAITRKDEILGAGTDLKYLLNRRVSVVAKYNYTNRDSNQQNQDYDRSVVTLGLRIEM